MASTVIERSFADVKPRGSRKRANSITANSALEALISAAAAGASENTDVVPEKSIKTKRPAETARASKATSASQEKFHVPVEAAADAAQQHQLDEESARTRREMARVAAPSPGTKRNCKKDLKRSLHVGEMIEVTRVDQHYLDQFNGGEKIRARFTGQDFYDVSNNTTYRSLSQWVKKRLVDVGAYGVKSNISGWDFVAVERDGRKQSIRMLVEDEEDDTGGSAGSRCAPCGTGASEGGSGNSAGAGNEPVAEGVARTHFTSDKHGEFSIVRRLAHLSDSNRTAESPSSTSSSPTGSDLRSANSPQENEERCRVLREELQRAREHVQTLEQQLISIESQKSAAQKHEYALRARN